MVLLNKNYLSTLLILLSCKIVLNFSSLYANHENDHSPEIDDQSAESRESLREKYSIQNRSCSLEKASICFYGVVNNITKSQSENLNEALNRCVDFGARNPCIGKPCRTDCLLRGPQPLGEVKNLSMTSYGPKFDDGLTITWNAFSKQKDLLYVIEYEEMTSEINKEKKFEVMSLWMWKVHTSSLYVVQILLENRHHFPTPSNCKSWNLHVKAVLNGSVVAISEKIRFPVKYNTGVNVTIEEEIHHRPTNTVMMEFKLSGLENIHELAESMLDRGSVSLIRLLSISENFYVLLDDQDKTFGPHTPSFIDDVPDILLHTGCEFYTIFVGSVTFLNRASCGVMDPVNKTIIMRFPLDTSSNKSCIESLRCFAEHQDMMLIAKFDPRNGQMAVYDLPSEKFRSNFSMTDEILHDRKPKFRLQSREVQRINLKDFDEEFRLLKPPPPPPPPLFLAYILPGFLTFILCVLICIYLRRKHKLSIMANMDSKSNDTNMTILADKWELPRNRLLLEDKVKLGAGEFGAVYKAQMLKPDNQLYTVAVKTLTVPTTSLAKENFLEEIKLMKHLGYHERLVNMLGCLTIEEPYYLIVEYCAGGDLHHFLRTKRLYMAEKQMAGFLADEHFLSIEMLLTIAWQVACGMEYMSDKQFIHRDLAARNVLLVDEENVKIGDFGLSRHFQPENFYYTSHGGRLPIKWMALESLTEYKFTSASDVWSFGVLLFELITLGGSPYPEIDPHSMENYLKSGKRMAKPENCPDQLYDLMQSTWKSDPQERPNFSEIKDSLKTMINDLKEFSYDYLTLLNNNNLYANVI